MSDIDYNKIIADSVTSLSKYFISEFFKKIGDVKKNTLNGLLKENKKSIEKYLKTTLKKYYETKTIINSAEPVEIEKIYVSMDLEISDKTIEGEIQNIIDYNKPIVISGLAGCGKSTLLKHLFIDAVKLSIKIPLFIELKNIKQTEENFVGTILKLLNELNLKIEIDDFIKLLDNGIFIIIFDGFDEVSPLNYDFVSKGIVNMRDKYYSNNYIISSRPTDDIKTWHNFSELTIKSLTKEKAIKLINNIDYDKQIKERFISDLEDHLFSKHYSFLSNPLLLTIMLITYSQYAEIPDKIHLFYQQAFDALFQRHDATKEGFKRTRYLSIPIDEYIKIISAVSLQSYIKYETNFEEKDLLEYIDNSKRLISTIDFEKELVLKDLKKSICLIIRDGLLYTFTHRSFQEYFAAIFIINCDEVQRKKILSFSKNRIDKDNVFRLVLEMNKNIFEDDFLLENIKEIKGVIKKEKKSNEAPEVTYFRLMFEKIDILLSEKNEWACTLNNKDYVSFYVFMMRNYYKYNMQDNTHKPKLTKEFIDFIKNDREISINELLNDDRYKESFLSYIEQTLLLIKKILDLPETIEVERNKKRLALHEILQKK